MIIIAEVSELTRKIKLPTDRVLSVNGDYQVDGIAFKLPATYEGDFDFSTAAARVHWTGVDKVEHTNLITEVDGNGYPLWVMPSELTQGGHGVIEFAISFVATDATAAVTKRWISDPVSFRNRRTVNGSNEDEEAAEETTYDRLASAIAAVRAAQAEVEDTNAVLSSLTGAAPVPVENKSDMVDDGHLYLYTGDETGLVTGNLYYYVNGTLTNGGKYGSMEVDATLTQSGQAADAKKTGDEISQIKEDLSTKTGLSEEAKQALLACFLKVAWVDEHGQEYYDALEDALYPPADLVRIVATYNQSKTVYTTDKLNVLIDDLTVSAVWSDGTSTTVSSSDYTLSGALTEGESTITVSYKDKTATFIVTVTYREGQRYLTINDVVERLGFTNMAVSNGTVSYDSARTFSIYEIDPGVLPLITDIKESMNIVSNKIDENTYIGYDAGGKRYRFTKAANGLEYTATAESGDGEKIVTGTPIAPYIVDIVNGTLTLTGANNSGKIECTYANCFGGWCSYSNGLKLTNCEVNYNGSI